MEEKEKFNYALAIKELQEIVAKVEDPSVGLEHIDKYIKRSKQLIEQCREYLRSARDKADKIEID